MEKAGPERRTGQEMTFLPRFGFALILPALMIGGCQSTAPAPIHTPTSALQLFETLPAEGSVLLHDLRPAAASRVFALLDPSGAIGKEVKYTRAPTNLHDATETNTEEGREIEFTRIDENGNVIMPAHIDLGENALSLFTPPLVMAYAELPAGEKRSCESDIRAVDPRNPRKLRGAGKATRTIEYRNNQKIRTPLGEFIAKRVETHFTADLKLADADDLVTFFVVPDTGVVAIQVVRNVRVLGAFGNTIHRTMVLMPSAP